MKGRNPKIDLRGINEHFRDEGEINPQTNLIRNSHRAKVGSQQVNRQWRRVAKQGFQECHMLLRAQIERKFYKGHDLFL